eukprot:1860847-Amphidinium_carterae.1
MAVPHLCCLCGDSVEVAFYAEHETTVARESAYAVHGKKPAEKEQNGVIQREYDALSAAELIEHADK